MEPDSGQGRYETTAAQLEPVGKLAVDVLGVLPGERVLDLGCGTGNAARSAARRGARVVGVDPAPRLLSAAEAQAQAEGLHVEWKRGEGARGSCAL